MASIHCNHVLLLSAQVEDDMILTLNHILLYQEESELLENRMYVMATNEAVRGSEHQTGVSLCYFTL